MGNKLKKICSKKDCNNIGTKVFCTYKKTGYYYCDKHYRFRYMRREAIQKRKFTPTWEECENLLFFWCPTFCCPICNKKLEWHTNASGLKNVISLQHNNDGTVMFICQGCNCAHGASKLGDEYFNMSKGNKYCSACKKILPLNKFHKNKKSRDKYDYICRKCKSIKSKIRYYENKKYKT